MQISQVDATQNNAVTGEVCHELGVTESRELNLVDGACDIACVLPPFAFACWSIQVLG